MKKYSLIVLMALCLLTAGRLNCSGQAEFNFLPDKEDYINELNRFFENYKSEKFSRIIKEFIDYAESAGLEENEWIEIADVSNGLTSRQINPSSYLSSFIEAVSSFRYSPDRKLNFPVWSLNIRNMLNREKREIKQLADFCSFTTLLHKEKILFKSPTITWKISIGDFKFINGRDFYVQTGKTHLVGIAGRDSSRIQDTRGRFFPFDQHWLGSGGKVSWERLGIDNDLVFVQLGEYNLDLSRSVYTLDSVKLIDRRYFNYPLAGRLEDKVVIGVSPERSGYPKFLSYDLNHRIKSIFPNMDYFGGYSLEGKKIIGSSSDLSRSQIFVNKENIPVLTLKSHRFVFDEEGAKGLNTSADIYIDSDSIIHPGLFFQYKKNKNELVLMRDGTGSSKSRFFDSFHQLSLDVEMMTWFPGDTLLYLSGMVGTLENNAVFQSADYFSIEWFNEIQLADLRNPLVMVKRCSDKFNSRFYFSTDLSEFMQRPLHLVEEMLLNISYHGFVRFNTDTKLVEVLQRTFDFLNHHSGQLDHDIIRFRSNIQPPSPNGIINLRTGSMQVFGVQEVELSDSRNVSFYPAGQQLTVDRERDISFDGTVVGGLLKFEGAGFIFNYEDFQLHLTTVDKIRLSVHIPLDKNYRETVIVELSSVIENTKGVLMIDDPGNKAGNDPEDSPQFPQFRTDTTAYVYYDQKYVQNGAYTRDSFYFEIDPTIITGLNDLLFKDKLFLPGTFFTYGIFPPLELSLSYKDDKSLGFDTLSTPAEGYPVYYGRGIFYNDISMGTSGLRGKGILTYLGSTIVSDDFLFLPDEVKIKAEDLTIAGNSTELGNPEIIGSELTASWHPWNDELIIESSEGPIKLYGTGQFSGKLIVGPEALRGSGTLSMDGYSVTSDSITLMENRFDALDSRLVISSNFQDQDGKTGTGTEADFIANHVDGSVDLVNRLAEFTASPDKSANLEFPVNKFSNDQASFTWNMDQNNIYMGESKLISTRPDQDKLSFSSENSVFEIDNYTIEADQVPFIDVADVRVYPGAERATIRINASIDSLPGSTITSRDTLLGHVFRNAIVRIRGKNDYSASGYYAYKDITGRELPLFFSEIAARPGRQSEGKANVSPDSSFLLSPQFSFRGTAEWKNREKLLNFDGAFMLTHDCPNITKQWVRFKSKIDPERIIIPIDSLPKSTDQESIYQGFYMSNQPVELYSTFLGPHTRYSDHPVLSAFGNLEYDYARDLYVIQNPASLQSSVYKTVLTFDPLKCITSGSGVPDLGFDLGQVKLQSSGEMRHDLVKDSLYTDIILAVDFFLDDKLLEDFTQSLNSRMGLEPVNYSRPEWRNSILSWLGKERGQELLNELSLMGSFRKIPEEFNHTIFLTDLKLKWNPERGSYQSVGKIGIGNIGEQSVNKLVNGHVELVHRRGGDTFTLYIEFSPQSYYYFFYNRNLMQVLAGPDNESFNNRVRDINPRKRRLKTKSGEPRYEFALGQFRLVRNFLDEINAK